MFVFVDCYDSVEVVFGFDFVIGLDFFFNVNWLDDL